MIDTIIVAFALITLIGSAVWVAIERIAINAAWRRIARERREIAQERAPRPRAREPVG